jgi:hypothetical protein
LPANPPKQSKRRPPANPPGDEETVPLNHS